VQTGCQPAMSRRLLIVGGSGYLGQFLVEDLATTNQVRDLLTRALRPQMSSLALTEPPSSAASNPES
jgi:tRNA A37 N6-isopentenylltransferase MiaA